MTRSIFVVALLIAAVSASAALDCGCIPDDNCTHVECEELFYPNIPQAMITLNGSLYLSPFGKRRGVEEARGTIVRPAVYSLPNLVSVTGELGYFFNDEIRELSFPALEIVGGDFQITDANLSSLSVPNLNFVGDDIIIRVLPSLSSLNFDSLTYVYDNIFLATLDLLESANFPSLTKGMIDLNTVNELTSLSLPLLQNGSVVILTADKLQYISAPAFVKGKNVWVYNAANLHTVLMPQLETLSDSLSLYNLPLLSEINFESLYYIDFGRLKKREGPSSGLTVVDTPMLCELCSLCPLVLAQSDLSVDAASIYPLYPLNVFRDICNASFTAGAVQPLQCNCNSTGTQTPSTTSTATASASAPPSNTTTLSPTLTPTPTPSSMSPVPSSASVAPSASMSAASATPSASKAAASGGSAQVTVIITGLNINTTLSADELKQLAADNNIDISNVVVSSVEGDTATFVVTVAGSSDEDALKNAKTLAADINSSPEIKALCSNTCSVSAKASGTSGSSGVALAIAFFFVLAALLVAA